MKRINSRKGICYTFHRNRLSPDTAKGMIFVNGCYVREDGGLTTRQRVQRVDKERSSKFIFHQSISWQIDRDEATEDLDDLRA